MATPVPASTADITAEKLSCSSTTRGFCFTFEKIVERRREGSVLESRQNSFGLSYSEPEAIVLFVRSDPEPIVFAVALTCDGSIAPANLNRVDAAFLLEALRRMS